MTACRRQMKKLSRMLYLCMPDCDNGITLFNHPVNMINLPESFINKAHAVLKPCFIRFCAKYRRMILK